MKRTRHTKALVLAFVINTLLTIIEYTAGIISGSAAVLADGSQNLTDSLVLTIAYICERLVARPHLRKRTVSRIYRVAGSLNAIILICLSYNIGFLAVNRVLYPHLLNSALVIAIGVLSIIINGWAARLLFSGRRDFTTRGPYIGLLFSGLSGVGVLLSGLAYHFWHIREIDGIVGTLIAALLLIRSIRLLISSLRLSEN